MTLINITYRYATFIFAFWLLLISSGIIIDFHYCQGEIKSIAFYNEAESCHDSENGCTLHQKSSSDSDSHCKKHDSDTDEDNCCHNKKQVVKLSVKYDIQKSPSLKGITFYPVVNLYLYSNIIIIFNNIKSVTKYYRPPPLGTNPQALLHRYTF